MEYWVVNSPEILNYYINHSEIKKHIAKTDGWLDSTEVMKDPNHVMMLFKNGCLLFLHQGDTVYGIDIYFLPGNRGKEALSAAKRSLDYMFSRGASKITAKINKKNKPSRYLARSAGFSLLGDDGENVMYEKWAE